MPEIIGIYPGGTSRIKHNGSAFIAEVFKVRAQNRESKPVDMEGFYIDYEKTEKITQEQTNDKALSVRSIF